MSDYGPDGYYADPRPTPFPWSGRDPLPTWPEHDERHERDDDKPAGQDWPREVIVPRPTFEETQEQCFCGHLVGQHESLGCLGGGSFVAPCPCERSRRSLVMQQRRERVA